ncbi:MAG: O-antigen ligase family protein [Sphingomonas sp.]|nr:O-antigen ligase family protein [Sphingomonas sp.]
MTARLRDAVPSCYLALCLLLGGSSSGGVLANAALQAIGLLIMVFVAMQKSLRIVQAERQLLLLGAGVIVIGLVQLVPLPPSVWAHLPGRSATVQGFALLNAPLPWLPISLWPAATLSQLAAMVPPFAIAIMIFVGGSQSLRLFAWTLVALAAASFLLGFAQLAGGPESPLYLYLVTNREQLVGFFANSNHLATLGVVSLPLLAALTVNDGGDVTRRPLSGNIGKWAAMTCLAGFIMLGVVADRSIAGLLLLVPSAIGSFVLLRVENPRVASPLVAGLLIVSAAILVVIAFQSPLLSGLGSTDLGKGATSRTEIFARTYAAIVSFFPFGSGLGSFLLVYPSYADHAVASEFYVNHAHNDYLEVLLETGLAGLCLVALFMAWWVRQAFFAWREGGARARFARAASIATALVMAHSLVDYPLRTTAIMVLFAACCAIMARPLSTVTSQLFAEGAKLERGRMVIADA